MKRFFQILFFCLLFSCGSFFGIEEDVIVDDNKLVGTWEIYKIDRKYPTPNDNKKFPLWHFTSTNLIVGKDTLHYEINESRKQLKLKKGDHGFAILNIYFKSKDTMSLFDKVFCGRPTTFYKRIELTTN